MHWFLSKSLNVFYFNAKFNNLLICVLWKPWPWILRLNLFVLLLLIRVKMWNTHSQCLCSLNLISIIIEWICTIYNTLIIMNIICTCNAVYIMYQSPLSFINSALLSNRMEHFVMLLLIPSLFLIVAVDGQV